MWHTGDGSEVAAAKPRHMPRPVPQISTGREGKGAGSSAEGQGIIYAAVISAGRGIFTNELLCSQQGAGNVFP